MISGYRLPVFGAMPSRMTRSLMNSEIIRVVRSSMCRTSMRAALRRLRYLLIAPAFERSLHTTFILRLE